MKPLNYLRDATKEIQKTILSYRTSFPSGAAEIARRLDQAHCAEKFILPNKGRILDDAMRALPETLHLPFPVIILEYSCITDSVGAPEKFFGKDQTVRAPKRIVLAEQEEDRINIFSILQYDYEDGDKSWFFLPFSASIGIALLKQAGTDVPDISMEILPVGDPSFAQKFLGPDWRAHARVDLADEIRAVFELIEALSCSNVDFSEKVSSAKPNSKQKKDKLPFDSYRILTIIASGKDKANQSIHTGVSQSDRCSPREHVRRGHVRQYTSGLKIWINNIIVNPGGDGKISKVYSVS